jgi:hypothetical protein
LLQQPFVDSRLNCFVKKPSTPSEKWQVDPMLQLLEFQQYPNRAENRSNASTQGNARETIYISNIHY